MAGRACFAAAGLYGRFGGGGAALLTLLAGVALTLVGSYVLELEAPYLTAVVGCLAVYALIGAAENQRGETTASGSRPQA